VPVKLWAENGPDSPTGQKSQTSDRPSQEEMDAEPQSQLNNSNQELKKEYLQFKVDRIRKSIRIWYDMFMG